MSMKTLRCIMLITILACGSFPAYADRPMPNPKVEEKLRERQGPGDSVYAPLTPTGTLRMGVKKEKELPPRDTFYQDGEKRVSLETNPAYMVLRFAENVTTKDQRVKYYREKVKMVVGELRPKELQDLGLFGVRLQPGGTAKALNHLMEYMKYQDEVVFIGRVFTGEKNAKAKFPPLLFTMDEIELTPKDASPEGLAKLEKDYPLKRKAQTKGKAWRFQVLGKQQDPVDLANALVKAEVVLTAKPLFVTVEATKAITPIDAKKLIDSNIKGILKRNLQSPAEGRTPASPAAP